MDSLGILNQLENAQLVRRIEDAELWYLFKHTLTQESVYESLLKSKRADLHRRVAEAIESLCGKQLEQNAAMLALHYERAGVDDKAFTYAALAGDIAARSYAHQEALMLYDRALAIAARAGEPGWNVTVRVSYSKRGRVLEVSGNHAAALENYSAMVAFARRVGDVAMEADGLTSMLTAQGILGDVPDADQQLMQALELARRSGDQALIGRALWNLGLAVRFKKPDAAAEYYLQALEHARVTGLRELEAYILSDLAAEMQFIGMWKRAREYSEQALAQFQVLDNKPMIANALGNLAESHHARGEAELAGKAAQEGSEISQAIENPWGIGYNQWVLLNLNVDAGEFDLALERARQILAISSELGMPLFLGLTNVMLARVYSEVNHIERSQGLADAAAHHLSFMDSVIWSSIVNGLSARLALSVGKLDRARELLKPFSQPSQLLTENLWVMAYAGPALAELAFVQGEMERSKSVGDILIPRMDDEILSTYSAEMRYWRARAALALGDTTLAAMDLERARDVAANGKNRILLWRIHIEIAELAAAQGDSDKASHAVASARELITAIASCISNPILKESFLQRPDVRQIADASFSIINHQ